MKKKFMVTAFAVVLVVAASAQTEPPTPPKAPKSPVENIKDLPPPPPPPVEPPPPPPPKPPKAPTTNLKDVAPPPPPPVPADEASQGLEEYEAFLKRNPSLKSLHWTMDEVIINLKSGTKERYNLSDEKSIKDAEVKYGKLPVAPPPPPPPPPPQSQRTLS